MSNSVVSVTLGSPVATSGTFNVPYPAGKTAGSFKNGRNHYFVADDKSIYAEPDGASFAFNSGQAVVTYRGAPTLPAGMVLRVNLDERGFDIPVQDVGFLPRVRGASLSSINLGSPIALSTTAVCAAQAVGGAVDLVINGAAAAGGVATFDAPRGVQVVSANAGDTTQTISVYGTDEYGKPMRENLALNGTSARLGIKAFKTVTRVASSATTAGNVSVGNTDVLGLPVWLPAAGHVIKELQDGAAPTAGTIVAGLATGTIPTATNADVRGTYTPNAACNGTRNLQLVALLEDPTFLGNAQYNA